MIKVIAEFCQKHNGDISILKEMVHSPAEGGAKTGMYGEEFRSAMAFCGATSLTDSGTSILRTVGNRII